MDLFSALALTGAKISNPSFSYNNKDNGQGAKCALPDNVSIDTLQDDDMLELVVSTVSETTIQRRSQARQATASAKTTGAALVIGLQAMRAGGVEGVDPRLSTQPGRDAIRVEVLNRLKADAVKAEQARTQLRARAIAETQSSESESETPDEVPVE